MEECIFCKIKLNELPSTKVYEDEDFFIIKDINPMAKIHFIAIPKEHYGSLDMQTKKGEEVFGYIIHKISTMQEELGLTNGYRLVINQGEDAGQTVHHLHIHILGGEKLKGL
ncbi:MAG: HIT domain-containing protein [Clostridia bacterium]|nr:HIT domain-containing protein [Clostridia bacterium]